MTKETDRRTHEENRPGIYCRGISTHVLTITQNLGNRISLCWYIYPYTSVFNCVVVAWYQYGILWSNSVHSVLHSLGGITTEAQAGGSIGSSFQWQRCITQERRSSWITGTTATLLSHSGVFAAKDSWENSITQCVADSLFQQILQALSLSILYMFSVK